MTSLGTALHVFSAAERNNNTLFHTVRNDDGSWQPRWVALRTFATGLSRIATARVGTTIDTAVVTDDGGLFHAIRASDGTWSNWGNIENVAGAIENGVFNVTLAGIGSQLHVVAMSSSGEVYHAIRRADATWQRFRKVAAFANYFPSVAISAANVGGELQVGFIDDNPQTVRHTIRRTDGTWTPVAAVPTTGLTGTPGIVVLAGTV